jgi:hypothetical protein
LFLFDTACWSVAKKVRGETMAIPRIDPLERWALPATIVAVALLALTLRLHRIDHLNLSLDEAFTLFFSSAPWSSLWDETTRHEVQPPLYFALVKLFGGASEAALRMPSAVMGALGVAVTFIAGLLAGGSKGRLVGLVAALIVATSLVQVQIGQTARHYSMFVLATAVALAGLFAMFNVAGRASSALAKSTGQQRGRLVTISMAITAFGVAWILWAHNVGVVYVISAGAAALAAWALFEQRDATLFFRLALAGAAALALWSPAIPVFVAQLNSISGSYWIADPTVQSILLIARRNYGVTHDAGLPLVVQAALCLAIGLTAAWGAYSMWRDGRKSIALICAVAAVAPFLLLTGYSVFVTPVLILRVVIPTFVPWVILIGYGVASAPATIWRVALSAILLGAFSAGLTRFYLQVGEPWRAIAQSIAEQSEGTAVVFTVPNTSALPLSYYADQLDTPLQVVPIPDRFPAVEDAYAYPTGVQGVPGIEASGLARIDQAIAQYPDATFWITLRGYPIYDPEGLLKRHLDQRFCTIRIDDGSIWYMSVLKLVPLESAEAVRCSPQNDNLHY